MASQRTKFTVGLFLTAGIGMLLLALIWLGMSRFLEKGQYYATYFNESVQGLEIDSPVKYRGVPIGRVESVGVAPDSKLIQVTLKIESGQKLESDIVAQLKPVGITGSVFVELDRKREGEPDQSPQLSFPSEYPIVASRPSGISEILRGIDDVLKQMKSLDLAGISGKIKLTLDNINGKVSDANVKGISHTLESSLERIDHILGDQRWDHILASVEEAGQSLNALMDKADRSLSLLDSALEGVEGIVSEEEKNIKAGIEDFRKAMDNANTFFAKGSSLVTETDDSLSYILRHLLVMAQNLEKASDNLNRLIEIIADQPSQLVFGEPPTPRKVGQDVQER